MVKSKRIIGTPFKSFDAVATRRTNFKIRGLAAQVRFNKIKVDTRDIRDTIESRNLPNIRTAGAIE